MLERQALGLSADAFVATTFGTVHERKGQLELIDAWLAWVCTRQRFDSRLFVVGPQHDPAYLERIKSLIGGAGHRASLTVVLTGFSADVRRYLRAADIYITAAVAEGLPISIVEALAHGVPVVCRHLSGVTEDFLHRDAVTSVLDWNSRSVGTLLDKMANSAFRQSASMDARNVAEERFGIENRLLTLQSLLTQSPLGGVGA
jgi:glycosyltransferase involved in cell wall biosynthesis